MMCVSNYLVYYLSPIVEFAVEKFMGREYEELPKVFFFRITIMGINLGVGFEFSYDLI